MQGAAPVTPLGLALRRAAAIAPDAKMVSLRGDHIYVAGAMAEFWCRVDVGVEGVQVPTGRVLAAMRVFGDDAAVRSDDCLVSITAGASRAVIVGIPDGGGRRCEWAVGRSTAQRLASVRAHLLGVPTSAASATDGVWIERTVGTADTVFAATDRYRVHVSTVHADFGLPETAQALVPAVSFLAAIGTAEDRDIKRLEVKGGLVDIVEPAARTSMRCMHEGFPPWRSIVKVPKPEQVETTAQFVGADLYAAARSVTKVSGSDVVTMTLLPDDNTVELACDMDDDGVVTQTIDASYVTGGASVIAVKSSDLESAARSLGRQARVWVQSPHDPVLFASTPTTFKALLSPLSLHV